MIVYSPWYHPDWNLASHSTGTEHTIEVILDHHPHSEPHTRDRYMFDALPLDNGGLPARITGDQNREALRFMEQSRSSRIAVQ
jgi:hypothetical protein